LITFFWQEKSDERSYYIKGFNSMSKSKSCTLKFFQRLTIVLPCAFFVSACSSSGAVLSAFGIGDSQKEPIDYSPRPPLAVPPPEQRGQLPSPQQQDAASSPPVSQPQDAPVVPPPAYGIPAPTPASAPAPAQDDVPWWLRIFS
jgi:hypothetical protein